MFSLKHYLDTQKTEKTLTHIDALYDKQQIDRTIQLYFQDTLKEGVVTKIYCYIAICGLLWSNWCEYKKRLGREFGEYALRQYQYAREYYTIVKEILAESDESIYG